MTVLLHDGLAVYAFGDGVPILFMPGPHRFQKPGDRSADAIIEGLARIGRKIITFDPPESGQSTRPSNLGMVEMHQCACEALDVCGAEGATDALGHSMGGLTTLAFAIDYPARVKRLVLVGTGTGGRAYMGAPGALWNRSHPAFWRMAALGILHIVWPRRATEKMLNSLIHRQSTVDPRWHAPIKVEPTDWLRPRRGRADWHRIASKLDYGPRLGEVAAPTLVLCGRHDPQYPPACSRELAAGIPGAQLVFFEHSGHYPFLEEAEAFWAAVEGFLHNSGKT